MRKKLDTRFPAARIKKIMQADEDVGKIAMVVPLLVSKALELFLQDLCDRTYEVTIQRGAKTMNSLHLKQCVQRFNVFDFLRDIVSKVPDLGGSEAVATGDEKCPVKRRKVSDEEDIDSDEEMKKSRMQHTNNGSMRGRGSRGRGRGRGRGGRSVRSIDRGESGVNSVQHHDKFEADSDSPHSSNDKPMQNHNDKISSNGPNVVVDSNNVTIKNFDLNENGEFEPTAPLKPVLELKQDEYPEWSLADVERMSIDPIQIANLNSVIDEEEEEEDYDE